MRSAASGDENASHFMKFLLGHEHRSKLFRLSFFSFSYRFVEVVPLQLGLLPVEYFRESTIETGNSHHRVAKCSWEFCSELSLKFLSIFVYILRSVDPITLIWVSLVRLFWLQNVQNLTIGDAKFSQSGWRQNDQTLVTAGYGRQRRQCDFQALLRPCHIH